MTIRFFPEARSGDRFELFDDFGGCSLSVATTQKAAALRQQLLDTGVALPGCRDVPAWLATGMKVAVVPVPVTTGARPAPHLAVTDEVGAQLLAALDCSAMNSQSGAVDVRRCRELCEAYDEGKLHEDVLEVLWELESVVDWCDENAVGMCWA